MGMGSMPLAVMQGFLVLFWNLYLYKTTASGTTCTVTFPSIACSREGVPHPVLAGGTLR